MPGPVAGLGNWELGSFDCQVVAHMVLGRFLVGCMAAVHNRVAADILAGYRRAAVRLPAGVSDLDRQTGSARLASFFRNPDTGSRCKLACCCSHRWLGPAHSARLHHQPASNRRSD